MKLSKKTGQSLVEVLIALGIIVLVLVGLIRAATVGVRTSSSSQMEALAARYGTEAIEWLKNEESVLGWVTFNSAVSAKTIGAQYCFPTTPLLITQDVTTFSNFFSATAPCNPLTGTTNLIRTVAFADLTSLPGASANPRTDVMREFSITLSWNEGGVARTSQYKTQITSVSNP